MAKEREITAKFKVDISDLQAGIKEANRHIRLANSEFKAATAGMDKWSTSADGLKAKIKQLNDVIDSEKTKLKLLEEQYSRVAKECGASSREAEELAIKINNQKASVNKAEAELKKYTKQLSEVKDGAKSFDKVGDAARDAAKDIDKTEDSLKKLSDGFTVAKGAIATFVGNALTSLAGSLKDGVSNILGLAEATQEYREDMGKLETAFSKTKVSVEDAKDTYSDFYSVLGEEDRSIEAVNHLAKFVDTEQDMAKWTDICTGVWGTFGDSLPIEGLTEAANETVRTGELTGVLVDALNWAADSGETFGVKMKAATEENEAWNKAVAEASTAEEFFALALQDCNTEQERQALITDTLTGLYKDAAGAYRENNKSIIDARKATAEYNDAMAEAGEAMEPVSTAFTKFKTVLVKGFVSLLKNLPMDKIVAKIEDLGKKLESFINNINVESLGKKISKFIENIDFEEIVDAIKNVATTIVNGLIPAVNMIIANLPQIITTVKAVVAVIAAMKIASFIQTIISIVSSIKGVVAGLGGLKVAFAALTGPVGIAVAAIGLIVTAFITLWKNCDGFREFWLGLWENIKSACSAAWQVITNAFNGFVDFVKNNWQGLLLLIANPFLGAFKLLYDNCEGFRQFWDGFLEAIKETASAIWESIKEFFVSTWEDIKAAWADAVDYFSGIWDGIKEAFSEAKEWLAEQFSKAWEAIKSAWDQAKTFFKDIWEGIKNTFSEAKEWLSEKFVSAWDAIKSAWGNTKDFFRDIWEGIKGIFSEVSSWFGDKFGEAWETIKSKFDGWGDFWSGLWTKIKDKFSDIGSNIGSAISDSIKSGLNNVLGFIENTINKGIRLINGAIDMVNMIPGVNIGSIGEISLPRLEKGGVLKKGQIGLLEGNGAEAVVPLENNKKWIRKTAQDMVKELGLQKQLNAQPTQPQQIINNNNFTQNNTSPKALSRLEIYRQTKNQLALMRG